MMSRIRAGSFGLDIAGLLVDKHDNNDEYDKQINDLSNKLSGFNDVMKNHYTNLQSIIDDNKTSISKQMNDISKEAKALANDRDKEIQSISNTNRDMWYRAIPKKISKSMNEAVNSVPKSTVYYRGYGQRETINNPSPGDICWESGIWDESASNNLKAQAYRYESGLGWQPIKGNQDIYGSNIFGAEIKGGVITGAFFRSNEQGALGSPFQVDDHGKIYAQNLTMDLLHHTTTEVNECSYSGNHKEKDYAGGLSFYNGVMHMQANVNQFTGKYVSKHSGNFFGATYLEPDYIKLRSLSTDDHNEVYGRTDIRGGNIEISNQWSQDSGIMLGYWTDNYTHGKSPEIKLANDMEIYRTGEGNMGFFAKNGFIFHQDIDIASDSNLFIHGLNLRNYIQRIAKTVK